MSGPGPKVSVIIPNYNHGKYFRQRIESVIHQTFQDFEIIILDDCSTDNSMEVIGQYAHHPKVTAVIANEKNSGSTFKQWERGAEHAKGDWIWFAESDDYADERFLELMLATNPAPGVGLVYCDSFIVTNDGTEGKFSTVKNSRFITDRWSRDHSNNGFREIEEFLLEGGTINNSSAVLFKRRIFIEAKPFDRELRFIGDKYAFIKVLSKSDLVYVSNALNHYRNPSAEKTPEQLVFYFYEQFLVFDWVHRNLTIDKKKFFSAFHANLQNSLVRRWNLPKIRVYFNLARINMVLLMHSVIHNFRRSLKALFG